MDANPDDAAPPGEQELPKRPRQTRAPKTEEQREARTAAPLFTADQAARLREVATGPDSSAPTQEQPRTAAQDESRPVSPARPQPAAQQQAVQEQRHVQQPRPVQEHRPAVPQPHYPPPQTSPLRPDPQPVGQDHWPRQPMAADAAVNAPTPQIPTNIYRARRPAAAVLLILPAIGFGFLVVRALAISAFGRPFVVSGVVASGLMLAAIPLLVSGLYGLITGAAHGAEQWGFRVWARPPLAYLVVGLALAAAAGLALG